METLCLHFGCTRSQECLVGEMDQRQSISDMSVNISCVINISVKVNCGQHNELITFLRIILVLLTWISQRANNFR